MSFDVVQNNSVCCATFAGLLRNETLGSTATQHALLNLTAGRRYNITMVTEASGLQSSVTVEDQTGRGRGGVTSGGGHRC